MSSIKVLAETATKTHPLQSCIFFPPNMDCFLHFDTLTTSQLYLSSENEHFQKAVQNANFRQFSRFFEKSKSVLFSNGAGEMSFSAIETVDTAF